MTEKWCKDSYCDGVREMYETRNEPAKFGFWTFIMIIMISGTGYFIFRVVTIYKESPTATTYSTVPMTSLTLPELLLCFNGGLNGTALKRANFSIDLIAALSGALVLGMMDSSTLEKSQKELDNFLIDNKINILQFYERFGYDCEDIVDIIYPAGADRVFHNIACQNVSRIMSPFYGVCLLYANNGVQHWPGMSGGMRIYLKSPPDSLSVLYPDIALKADRSQSFVVSIQKDFFIPAEKQFLVPTNMKTEITIDTKHYIRLPESKASCSPQIISSSNDCFNRAFGNTFFDSCGCYPFRYYNSVEDKEKKVCNVFEEQSCQNYNSKPNPNWNCIPICDEWVYDVTLSYAPSGSEELPYASVWMGYDSMQITKVSYQC